MEWPENFPFTLVDVSFRGLFWNIVEYTLFNFVPQCRNSPCFRCASRWCLLWICSGAGSLLNDLGIRLFILSIILNRVYSLLYNCFTFCIAIVISFFKITLIVIIIYLFNSIIQGKLSRSPGQYTSLRIFVFIIEIIINNLY